MGETALYVASLCGHVEIVKLLIQRKAEVNICKEVCISKDSSRFIKASLLCVLLQNGCSPVCGASEKGHTEVVDLLVSAGADVHKATTTVSTLLISAV